MEQCAPVISRSEVVEKLKTNRASADDGLVAELLKIGHDGIERSMPLVFTDLSNVAMEPPTSWERS